jgi:hypothetical protein
MVWVGEYSSAERDEEGYYWINMKKVEGPLEVKMSLSDLTGKREPENPVFLTLTKKGPADPKVARALQKAAGERAKDVSDLFQRADYKAGNTEIERLVLARLGQGDFRRDVLRKWENACAVTGITVVEAIRASHIVPWRTKTETRLNPNNGLPLVATLDALFDCGLISFDIDGAMLVSPFLGKREKATLGIPANLRKVPGKEQAKFLRYHRQHVFLASR